MSDLLTCFQTFCRVVERGSISRAAIDIDLAQATVSRHLQELESRYGVVLITRTTRSLNITSAGQQVYEYARSVLRSEAELADRLKLVDDKLSGRITVAGPSGFGHVILNPFVLSYTREHHNVRLRLLFSERHVNLVEEDVEVAIRIGRPIDSSLIMRPLGTLRERLVISPSLIPTDWQPEDPTQLASLSRVALIAGITRNPVLSHNDVTCELDTPAVLEVDSSLALRDALLAGMGYGAIHEYLVADFVQCGRLVELLPEWTLPTWPLNALFPSRNRPYRVDHFIDNFVSYVRSQKIVLEELA